jgi:signal transduction histidine kinase
MTHVANRLRTWLSKIDLKSRLILFSVIPLNILLLAAFLYGLYMIETATEKTLQEDLELIARTIQGRVEHSIATNNLSTLNEILHSAFKIRRVYGIYVYDNAGDMIWQLGSSEPDHSRSELRSLAEGGVKRGEYRQFTDREVYSFFLPLTGRHGQNLGLLQLTRKREEIQTVLNEVRKKTSAIMILTLTLSTGALILADRFFIQRPVKHLRQAMSQASTGDLQTRVQLHCPPELQSIGHSLNSMLYRLETARHENQKQKKDKDRLKQELRKAERLATFGQFAAGIAHDVGTPLSVIDGIAQRALRRIDKGNLNAEARPMFTDIAEEARRMDAILLQLLDFARGKPIHKTKVMLNEIINSSVNTLTPIADANHVALEFNDNQKNAFHYELMADPTQIQQVLINIIKNGIEAARQTVRLTAHVTTDHIILIIDDDGQGIDPEVAEKLFEPFVTSKRRGSGSGLGLAVAHGIVAAHNGHIQTKTSDLGGARFEITLPRWSNPS